VVSGSLRSDQDAVVASQAALPSPRQAGAEVTATERALHQSGRPALAHEDRSALVAALAEQIARVERQADTQPAPRRAGEVGMAGGGDDQRVGGGRRSGDHVDGREPDSDESGAGPAGVAQQQAAEARAICLRLLAVAPRPRAGLAQALKRKEIPDAVAEAVLDRLTAVGLIDDAAYASSFVRTKHRDRALGRSALHAELRKLGVDEESVADAVSTVDSDAEAARAAELIAKRLDAAMSAGPVAAKRRLLGLLARRGYPPDVAVAVVDRALAGYSDGVQGWS
jgi:regulatory protein